MEAVLGGLVGSASPGFARSPLLAAQDTRLILLGTGTPNADPERSGPALAVVVDSAVYLVAAGPGVVRRAAAAGFDVKQVNRVFLTHLHSDHTVGLPDLLLTPWVLEREQPLEVFGPRGTAAMMRHIERAYEADIRRRIDGIQPQNPTGWRAAVHEITPGVVYEDANVRVTAFLVDHEDWPEAFGFRFDTRDRSIVVSGTRGPASLSCRRVRGVTSWCTRSTRLRRSSGVSPSGSAIMPRRTRLRLNSRNSRTGRGLGCWCSHTCCCGARRPRASCERSRRLDRGRVVAARDLDVF